METEILSRAQRRRAATDAKIAEATLAIALSDGVPAVTIDAVSQRSGVAKTTIYRRYTDRLDLMKGVLDQFESPLPVLQGGNAKADAITIIGEIRTLFEEKIGLASVGTLVASADPFLRAAAERIVRPYLRLVEGQIRAGVEAGYFRAGIDPRLLVEMVFGGLVASAALREEVPDDWVDQVVSLIWPMIAAESAVGIAGEEQPVGSRSSPHA